MYVCMYVCMYTWFKVINKKNSIFCLGALLLILIIFIYLFFILLASPKKKQSKKTKTKLYDVIKLKKGVGRDTAQQLRPITSCTGRIKATKKSVKC